MVDIEDQIQYFNLIVMWLLELQEPLWKCMNQPDEANP
jgi:hypothetical protein